MKIIDYYVHQGNQYEFAKTGHEYYITGLNSIKPNWNVDHRPLLPNIHLIDEREAIKMKFDVVMIRSPLNMKRYNPYLSNGAKGVAVVQTTDPFKVDPRVKNVVWNSMDVMNSFKGFYQKNVKHKYIVHGFDPNEFRKIDIKKINRVLTVANVFKPRDHFLDYGTYSLVSKSLGICDVVGHGNNDITESIGEAKSFNDLIKFYNSYSVYLNTTVRSAMPRSRAEAAMSGMAIVSTSNYDIDKYFIHNKNILFANNSSDMVIAVRKLLNEPDLCLKMGEEARKVALEHFHIDKHVADWNNLLRSL
jgi:glycosyltransferase involved in cell wall biosynthesis